MSEIAVGSNAPDFALETPEEPVKLADFAGKTLVLYFYPKDDTTGCTNEAKAFSALAPEFARAGATVVGVSKDSVASHRKFADKYGLQVKLASDPTGETVERYGSWVEKSLYGRKYMGIDRSTFLIEDGVVTRVWRKVRVPGHAEQVLAAAGVAAAALWTGVASASMLLHAVSASSADRQAARTDARPRSSVAALTAEGATAGQLAVSLEKRHAALAMLLTGLKDAPGAAQTLIPIIGQGLAGQDASPAERIQKLEVGQQQLLDAADSYARSRADRLRLALRLTGVTPSAYLPKAGGLGGPLVEPKDPRALAALLGVDADFAGRIQHAEHDLWDARELAQAAQALPLAPPTADPARSSGFGVRTDPFTHRPAFHTGLDFPGARMTPVYATGPGVVAYTGPRSGYGKVVEVDHGGGLKTRYAHLQSIAVHAGEPVAPGERLGGMGSTGRSTGTHLHYEVWLNGRPVNPERFLKAGAYVNAAG